jgi:hypothetical protein
MVVGQGVSIAKDQSSADITMKRGAYRHTRSRQLTGREADRVDRCNSADIRWPVWNVELSTPLVGVQRDMVLKGLKLLTETDYWRN